MYCNVKMLWNIVHNDYYGQYGFYFEMLQCQNVISFQMYCKYFIFCLSKKLQMLRLSTLFFLHNWKNSWRIVFTWWEKFMAYRTCHSRIHGIKSLQNGLAMWYRIYGTLRFCYGTQPSASCRNKTFGFRKSWYHMLNHYVT